MIERMIQSKSGRMLLFVVGLLTFFALALQTAVVKSPTADEVIHLLRGQTLWQTGDMALQGQHTPFSHWLIGSLFFTEPTAPDVTSLPSWESRSPDGLIAEFLWENGLNVDRLLFLGRLPIIFVGLFLGAIVVSWAGKAGKKSGQFVVLCLFAFSPNIIAFAALATTDLVAAVFMVATLFTLWHYWQAPSRALWLLTGTALGLALGAKLTAIFLLPVTLLLCYISARNRNWWKPGLIWLSFLPTAGLVLWALFAFEIGPVDNFPIPLPASTYIGNFIEVQAHIERGHYSYLLGQISNEGWWYYFAVAFLVKMPLTVLLLLTVGLIYIVRQRKWINSIYYWLPAGSLFAVATFSGLNIGYRHILAVVPLTWLLISQAVPWMQKRRALRWLLVLGLVWYGVESLWQQPDYLAFFNKVVGGSSQGYKYLGDSNIDWGQDLEQLVAYVAQNQVDPLYVSYFGAADRDYYGLENPQLFDEEGNPLNFSPANPAPGKYALSVNLVQSGTLARPDIFDSFREREPVDDIGSSILIYEVQEDMDGVWAAHCFDPVPLVDEATAETYLGRQSLRHVYFDCRNSWVVPGEQPGWYILPADLVPIFAETYFPDELKLVYRSTNHPQDLDYHIYHWSGAPDTAERLSQISAPVTTIDGTPVDLPLAAGEGLARFRGGYSTEGSWGSAWEVLMSSDRNLSVQLHVYGETAEPMVADGLGFSVVQWRPGDIFIQFVPAEITLGLNGRFLETSLYDLDSGERLDFENGVSEVHVLADE